MATVGWPGEGEPVLYIHATGFHKWVWRKLATATGRAALAMDLRGHGDSGKPPDGYLWTRFGEEALAVVDQAEIPTPADGVGHSCGGATLLMAEAMRPGTFRRLVVFEPIVFPTEWTAASAHAPPNEQVPGGNPLATSARRRRPTFESPAAAARNYLSKPPMSGWDPEVMADYTEHGLSPREDGTWELKCPGEIEALVYEGSRSHDTWDRLHEIETQVLVLYGRDDAGPPALLADEIANRLPNGHARAVAGTHFGPMEHPLEVARIVADFLA